MRMLQISSSLLRLFEILFLISLWSTSAIFINPCKNAIIKCECGPNVNVTVPYTVKQCVNWVGLQGFVCKPCDGKSTDESCVRFKYCEECNEAKKGCFKCPSHRYGERCEYTCNCANGGVCGKGGKCECPPSHTGNKCEKAIVCPTLDAPTNGTVNSESTYAVRSTIVTFSCDEGFELNGAQTLYCLDNLAWSGKPPVCDKTCARSTYHSPKNGYVQRTSEKKTVGSMLLYTCSNGFALVGSATRVCLENGTWSGRPPTCEKLVFCEEPVTPENSTRRVVAGVFGYFSRGTNLTYTCRDQHNMIGNSSITCTASGKWTSNPPVCFSGNVCKDPGIPPHSQRTIHTRLQDKFLPGTAVQYQCDPLYYPLGTSVIECRNGTWSAETPSCLRLVTCTNPEELPNGYVTIFPPDSDQIGNRGRVNSVSRAVKVQQRSPGLARLAGIKMGDIENVETLDDIGFNKTLQLMPNTTPASDIFSAALNASEPQDIPSYDEFNSTIDGIIETEDSFNLTELETDGKQRSKREATPLPVGHHHIGSRARFACESQYYHLVGSPTRECTSEGKWSGNPPTCIAVCGKSSTPTAPFVINGTPSELGQWPWQVGIALQTESLRWFIICGGSLVNEHWIVTAAHCVTYEQSTTPVPPEDLLLYFGKYYRNDSLDDSSVEKRTVFEIQVHPDYDPKNFESDIALVRVTKPVTLTSRVQPVCLPESQSAASDERIKEGSVGTLIGWGMKETGKFSGRLQHANIPVISSRKCEEDYRKENIFITVTWNMFCGGFLDGRHDSCTGDSGGPLVFPYDETQKRWILEGIVSWGSKNGCGKAGQYGGYTRVQRFLEWIHNYIHT